MNLCDIKSTVSANTLTCENTVKTLSLNNIETIEDIKYYTYDLELNDGTICVFTFDETGDITNVQLSNVPNDSVDINYILQHLIAIINDQQDFTELTTLANSINSNLLDLIPLASIVNDNSVAIQAIYNRLDELITMANTVFLDEEQELTNKTINDSSNTVHADAVHYKIKNVSGSELPQWTVVSSAGVTGEDVVEVTQQSDLQTPAIGIVENTMSNNDFGEALSVGTIKNYPSTGLNVGDILYPNGTGGFTTTPTISHTNYNQPCALVAEINGANAQLIINFHSGHESSNLIGHDNSDSDLTSTNLKDAIDELDLIKLESSDIGISVQEYDADTAKTDLTQTFTAPQRGTVTVDNDGFDLSVTNKFSCTPTALFTLTFTNMANGQGGTIKLDNSGGYVITADANTKVDANFLTTVSTAGIYYIGYESDGTNTYVWNTGALS